MDVCPPPLISTTLVPLAVLNFYNLVLVDGFSMSTL